MKNINLKKSTITFLTVCAVIFGLTTLAKAAVNPELISKATNGSGGNNSSQNVSVSADGRYVVFQSIATNLVSGITDTNNTNDVFLRDTQTGTIRCLSCVSAANPTSTGNGFSINPIISPDGRYVVFGSAATDLVGGIDTNNTTDVFRFDTQLNERVLVSVVPFGSATGNGISGTDVLGRAYDMSDDGRYVVFVSYASNLTSDNDPNGFSDVFVRDMQLNSTRLVTLNNLGDTGNNDSADVSISADGRLIAFTSLARDLLPLNVDRNNSLDVFVFDNQNQQIRCASMSTRTDTPSTGSNNSFGAIISKDGSRVAYFTSSKDTTNILIPFADPFTNVAVYDVGFGQSSLATVNVAGNAGGNGDSGAGTFYTRNISISANGRYVTFESKAGNLSPLAPSGTRYNVFRRDLAQGRTEVASVNPAGTASPDSNSFVGKKGGGISGDGRFITFYSNGNNYAPDFPVSSSNQIYVRDMLNGITTALTLNNSGTALGNGSSNDGSITPIISTNGKAVVFLSVSTDLTPTPTSNQFTNIFKSRVPTPQKAVSDFDGDGKSDFAVWRPASGSWFVLPNTGIYTASTLLWGASGDRIVPADFTGDGRTDYAVWRPSNGTWYITDTANFNPQTVLFGSNGDVPLPGDYDGDGRADLAVFRPSNSTWYIAKSGGVPAQNFTAIQFGQAGDVPVAGDFDGDGKADVAVFRPSNGTWYYLTSTGSQFRAVQFGTNGDKAVPADYDGDGKTDVAVYRSGTWYILRSLTGQLQAASFGTASDIPVAGEYDGDGKADIAVFRPSEGIWYVLQSTNNGFFGVQFGQNGDAPVPAAFVR